MTRQAAIAAAGKQRAKRTVQDSPSPNHQDRREVKMAAKNNIAGELLSVFTFEHRNSCVRQ